MNPEQMRSEWNQRAKEDAHFYVAFGRQQQTEEEFLATADEVVPGFEKEFVRLPASKTADRSALEIGCGPGRLMLPMSKHFGEIHGVDVSEEMLELARKRLASVRGAQVHITAGSDLSMLGDDYFDFVYSYTVFQHIPSKDIVLSYLAEAQRVLKPGGVLCCQIRGIAPIPSELIRGSETWTGCWFAPEEMAEFSRRHRFPLVAISGLHTQYMFTTFRKPVSTAGEEVRMRATVKAVTSAIGAGVRIPQRGREAAVSLWLDGMAEDASLTDYPVRFDGQEQLGCYLSPVTQEGGCQMNCRLPDATQPGPVRVELFFHQNALPEPHEVIVEPASAYAPRVLDVTDGINLTSHYRVEMGGAKILMEDIRDPAAIGFQMAGQSVVGLQFESKDPITATYEFAFHLPHDAPRGPQSLRILNAGQEWASVDVDVV
ncbi:MAG: methyltransferase domain-containing protein [Bryobacteraceae bacterium]|nr:methyltransferase domain-containing protein [Bryobacteraceae bacterium]